MKEQVFSAVLYLLESLYPLPFMVWLCGLEAFRGTGFALVTTHDEGQEAFA